MKIMSAFKPYLTTKPTSCSQPGSSISYLRNLVKKKKSLRRIKQLLPKQHLTLKLVSYLVTLKFCHSKWVINFQLVLLLKPFKTLKTLHDLWEVKLAAGVHALPFLTLQLSPKFIVLFYCLYLYMLFSYSAPHLRIKALNRLGEICK